MSKQNSIITSAATLFQQRGVNAVGIKDILTASQVPKGSLYYYFPNGKREIIIAAINDVGKDLCTNVAKQLQTSSDWDISFHNLISGMVESLQRTNCVGSWSLSLMVLETTQDQQLNELCHQIVVKLSNLYAKKLQSLSISSKLASRLGLIIQSNLEGALMTSVALKDSVPLLLIEKQISQLVRNVINEH
ncbi:TetR/AcrR family transcriptional regulator [Levilactobacillus brevis]|uniref:TetR/AcrR family transcriptional regulator n=1 Tax=Levilactobacillus brevis TaxID=1580 RepID=UPI0039E663DC